MAGRVLGTVHIIMDRKYNEAVTRRSQHKVQPQRCAPIAHYFLQPCPTFYSSIIAQYTLSFFSFFWWYWRLDLVCMLGKCLTTELHLYPSVLHILNPSSLEMPSQTLSCPQVCFTNLGITQSNQIDRMTL
jgi:hypothetical protein